MKDNPLYIRKSLELHLFFARIMKEHAIFLEAGFTKANIDFAKEADCFKDEFENILSHVTQLGFGIISQQVCCSNEIVTSYTLDAERQTHCLTGIDIDEDITLRQLQMNAHCYDDLMDQVQNINCYAMDVLQRYIDFKETILQCITTCQMFTVNYPLLIEHILREAKLYYQYLMNYMNGIDLCDENMEQVELFWNQIMMEHALFIRGLLDPTEAELIQSANQVVKNYDQLLKEACQKNNMILQMQKSSLQETLKLRDFKEAGTKGILGCQIRSIILPLLADHVLREANHYIRLLENYCDKD